MVDGVNFNPFTGKVFTTDEIQKLDTDGDGKISSSELSEGSSWLSQTVSDEEGDVQIGSDETVTLTGNAEKAYSAAAKNGVQDSASDANQLKEYMNTIIDSYIEQYMQQNPDMSANEKSSLITFIKSQGQEFINQYVQQNTAVPYDTKSVTNDLINKLDSAISERKSLSNDVNSTVDNLKNNVDQNYQTLAETADKADNDYVTAKEFEQMKNEAIDYIMGMLMNGNEDSAFLSALNSDYKNSSAYKTAMSAIKAIEGESDPAKIQEYLDKAKTAISSLIGTQNADGTSKLGNAINAKNDKQVADQQTAQKSAYTETLSSLIDEMVENYSNSSVRNSMMRKNRMPSSDEVASYQTKLTNIMNKFLESYDGDGKNIESEFKAYVDKVAKEYTAAQNELSGISSLDSDEKYAELKDLVNSTGSYVSDDEKAAILNSASEFILNQIAQGVTDITLLNDILPDYQNNTKFIEAQALLKGLNTSATPKEDLEKAKQLISEMMSEVGADSIMEGVKNKKMPAVTFSDVEMEQFTSSIPGYDDDVQIKSDSFKGKDRSADAKNNLQEKAKAALEAIRPQLLAMMKEKLGADYDEAALNSMIDDAIYKTINEITESGMNVDHTNRIIKKKRKWTASISTKTLVDTFMTKFNEIATKSAGEVDKSKNPVDRDSVMNDTEYADAYQDKKSTLVKDTSNAKLQAKTQLQSIAAQLKVQLRQQLGSDYDSALINSLVDQAILNTVNSLEPRDFGSDFFNKIFGNTYILNTYDISNKFFDEFDKLYEEAYKDKTTTETSNS